MTKTNLSIFGKQLLAFLYRANCFERHEQARILKINTSQLSGMLRGRRSITVDKIKQFTKELSLSREDLKMLEEAALQSNNMIYTTASVKTMNGKMLVGVVIKHADNLPQNVIESIIDMVESVTRKN